MPHDELPHDEVPHDEVPHRALAEVRARGHIGIRLGLERMARLLGELGDPHHSLRGVLVGGTNGKGSVAAMVAAMLRAGGYSTLRSPSPHLSSYRERILIDGDPISTDDLDSVLAAVLAASLPGEPRHGPATQFELLIAAAFLWGARQGVDVAVMEVGLGGRLDATNTWDGGVAAITDVGLDHREYLGDTIAEIAAEKAAIIKPRDRAVTAARGSALAVIAEHCDRLQVPLLRTPPLRIGGMDSGGLQVLHDDLGRLRIGLLGRFQATNAAVALGIMDALDDAGISRVTPDHLRAGLRDVRWPGRMELLDVEGLTILLDGAHNPDGAASLAAALDELGPSLPRGRVTLMLGVMRDKEIEPMLRALARSSMLKGAAFIAAGVPDTDRGLAAHALAAHWARVSGGRSEPAAAEDANDALRLARDRARAEGGLLVVAGSLYLVGHVRSALCPPGKDPS